MSRDRALQTKDMDVLKEGDSALVQHKATRGTLKDYSLKHNVEMRWNLSEDAHRDMIFELKIDDYTVLLDAEEVLRTVRWV